MSDVYIDVTEEWGKIKFTIGKRIEVFRECEEMTQEELAVACNTTVNIIRGIEADLISVEPYKSKICEVLLMDESMLDKED